MRILGVDPGIRGGLAVVEITDEAAPVLVDCIDIPVVGVGAKGRIDAAAVRNFIDQHKPIRALIARAQAMPKEGSLFRLQVWPRRWRHRRRRSPAARSQSTIVEPGAWKKFHRFSAREGTRKAGVNGRCSCSPRPTPLRARKKDHGRAEASLIALHGARL